MHIHGGQRLTGVVRARARDRRTDDFSVPLIKAFKSALKSRSEGVEHGFGPSPVSKYVLARTEDTDEEVEGEAPAVPAPAGADAPRASRFAAKRAKRATTTTETTATADTAHDTIVSSDSDEQVEEVPVARARKSRSGARARAACGRRTYAATIEGATIKGPGQDADGPA